MTDEPDDQAGALFFALSDPLRRRVLQAVARTPDATVTEICDQFQVSRFAVMRHLNVLEEAGIIMRKTVGRERRVSLAIEMIETKAIEWLHNLRRG